MPVLAQAKTIGLPLPVVYLQPGQDLTGFYVDAKAWDNLHEAVASLRKQGYQPMLAYFYQPPQAEQVSGLLVISGGDARAALQLLQTQQGLTVRANQAQRKNLFFAEHQTPQLVDTPAVIFGRPIISDVLRQLTEQLGAQGKASLYKVGQDAGRLAASALPPLLEKLHLKIDPELLTRRLMDLQVMGWAKMKSAQVSEDYSGEIQLNETFEASAWSGKADSPQCDFIAGFISGVFSFATKCEFKCTENSCQATGAEECRFTVEKVSAA